MLPKKPICRACEASEADNRMSRDMSLKGELHKDMKILSSKQTQDLDSYTIKNEPIKSIDLMERASTAFVDWFVHTFPDVEKTSVTIFCGIGNNGGDGLAVARLLRRKYYSVKIFLCSISPNTSEDFRKNLKRLPRRYAIPITTLTEGSSFPNLAEQEIIVDALFGTGLNRPIEGYWSNLIHFLNKLPNTIVAIDTPSGLYADKHSESAAIIEADYTVSFELPKLAFFFPENQNYIGECFILPIGLNQAFIDSSETSHYFLSAKEIKGALKKRKKFDHKGVYGHALLIGASYGMVGAIILAGKACLRSGAGLVSIHAPQSAYEILQISFPEGMVSVDPHQFYYSENPPLSFYKAIGCGCGLNKKPSSQKALKELLIAANIPLVLDADALNIISTNKEWLSYIPKNSILTPHVKEFTRLFGESSNDFERNELQRQKAKEYQVFIILKGANTCIATPDGICYFNTTGNPGMATAGSGDVLTGILTGLLAQDYPPETACQIGVYLHGLAGDIAASNMSPESLIASDIIQYLGNAFQELRQ